MTNINALYWTENICFLFGEVFFDIKYFAYILLHRSLGVLSIILICCAHVVKEFIIHKMYRLT